MQNRAGRIESCLCFLGVYKAGGKAKLSVNVQLQHLGKQSFSWSCPCPAQVLTLSWVTCLPQFATSLPSQNLEGCFWGSLSVTRMESAVLHLLLQVPCQAPIKQQQAPLVSAASCLQRLATLPFTVPVPIMASPSCAFSKLFISSHLQHCMQKLQKEDISPDKSRGESLSGWLWTSSRICTEKKLRGGIIPSTYKLPDIRSQPPEDEKFPSWLQQETPKWCTPARRHHFHMGQICYNTGKRPPFVLKTSDTSLNFRAECV